jgi:hypothetical protein
MRPRRQDRVTFPRGFALATSALTLAATVPVPADAADIESSRSAPTVEIHGFVSQGFIKSTDNNYLVNSSRGSFEFSELGLNFTSQLTERLRVGAQIFAFDLGTLGNYRTVADWYYLDYRHRDWLGLRAGRLKLVYGLYNDISDIDAARAPILLPSSLYPVTNRDLLLGYTGAEVYGYVRMNRAGALEYRAYGGAISVDLPSQVGSPIQISNYTLPYLAGARLLWETPLDGLRVGGTGLFARVEANAVFPAFMSAALTSDLYAGVASAEYVARNLLVAAEYAQTRSESTSTDPTLLPVRAVTVAEGGYALAAYRLTPWLQPAAYYSLAYPNRNLRDGRENVQHDISATLRFDINNFWIVKLEAHYMHGTARLAGGAAVKATLPENWGLFLIKTTAYF